MVNHALGVTDGAVFMPRTHCFKKLNAGNTGSAGPVQNDFDIFDFLAAYVQGVD